MIIQGDVRANTYLIQALIANECQFVLHYPKKKLRVAFNKGDWELMSEAGDLLIINDSMEVPECSNLLLQGLAQEILKQEVVKDNNLRTGPAKAIARIIDIWIGKNTEITQIDIQSFERNSWFDKFDDPYVQL